MNKTPLALVAGAALLVLLPRAQAESRPQGTGFVLRPGLGVGLAKASVGGRTNSKTSPTLGFQAGYTLGSVALELDVLYQPIRVQNPVADESFDALYVLPSVRLQGRNLYGRAGLGLSRLGYSGPAAFESSSTSFGIGGALGWEFTSPRGFPLSVEAYARWGTSSDLELGSSLFGVQLVGSLYSRRR